MELVFELKFYKDLSLNFSAVLILPSSCNKIKINQIFSSPLEFLPNFLQILFMLVKYLISYFEFARFDCSDLTLSFFIRIPFTRTRRLTKRLKNKNYLGIMLTFFFFQTSTVFFKPSFKYDAVFQDQSEANIGGDLRPLYLGL